MGRNLPSNKNSFKLHVTCDTSYVPIFFSVLFATPLFIKGFRNNRKNLLKIILLGIILYIAYFTQTIGLEYTTSSKSAFIAGLYIIFTPIFVLFFIREKLMRKLGISLILAIIGLALLANISLKDFNLNFGDFITIISAITFSIQIVLTNIYAQETDIFFIAATQMIATFLVGLPFNGNFLQISLGPLIQIFKSR
ncbi:MAG: DMT family transporter [Caldisericota bacterium]|nr:DMT family transporter [Caldisericota bacterium]